MTGRRTGRRLLWLPLLLIAACSAEQSERGEATAGLPLASEAVFLDVTAATGVDFRHTSGDGYMDNILESIGSGALWFDVDNDDDLDLYLVNQNWLEAVSTGEEGNEAATNRLFVNRGDGTFVDRTREAGVGDTGFGYAVVAADVDNDGDPDLYLANCGGNRLFENRGDGTFRDVTDRSGVGGESCSSGATFLDGDGDGFLDLYVANYLVWDPNYQIHYAPDVYPGPLAYEAQADVMYRNRGDGTFEDVTAAWGMDVAPARAMGVVASDIDLDGRPDVFVANDASANFLFHNLGGGRFEEVGLPSGTAFGFQGEATGAMAGSIGDLDNDGLPDILVTDTSYGSLYRNTGDGLFEDRVMASGLAAPSGQSVSWGGGFFDFDNDGDQDVLLVNGDLKHPTGRPDLLMENLGEGEFEVADGGPYFSREELGRGGAFGDFDADGDLDVVITLIDGPAVLLRNDTVAGKHWLHLSLVGTRSNRDGLGSVVRVRAGGREWVRVHHAPSGYLTQSQPWLHFGLGEIDAVDEVEVSWPGGEAETWRDLEIDRTHRLVEGEAP